MFRFPFGTVQELNLDWFLEQWEIFKTQAREAFEGIDHALDDEIDRVEDAMTDLYAARDAAIAAKTAAETAESSTLGYAQSAANSAASAAGSATGSAQSASSSAGSAEQAAQSAQTSAQLASSAATSAGNAATSASNASSSAATAATNAGAALTQAQESAAWATGSYTGDPPQYPVPSTAPQHENNAKYYAESIVGDAEAAAASASDAADSADAAAASAASVSASAAQIAQNASDIADLQTDMTVAKSAITELQTDVDAAESDISGLQSDMTSALSDISTLQTDLDAAESDIADLQRDMTAEQGDLSNLTGALTDISGNTSIQYSVFSEKQVIDLSASVGSIISLAPTTIGDNAKYAIIPCSSGNKFTINGTSYSAYRLWAFLDSNNVLIGKASPNATGNNLVLTAPVNAAKLVLNSFSNVESYTGEVVASQIRSIDSNLKSIVKDTTGGQVITYSDINLKQAISLLASVGTVVDITPTTQTDLCKCAVVPCSAGDKFTINGTSYSGYRLWAFLDSDSKLIIKAKNGAEGDNTILIAPDDAAYLVLNSFSDTNSYYGEVAIAVANKILRNPKGYKKLLTIGDSLTNASYNGENWQPYVVNSFGLEGYVKSGAIGLSVATVVESSIYSTVQALTADSDVNLVTFWGGTNDYTFDVVLGDFDEQLDTTTRNTATFYGALIGCVEKLMELYPAARIIMIGTTPRIYNVATGANYHNEKNNADLYLSDYVDAVKTVAEWFGLPFLDLLRCGGINELNMNQYFYQQSKEVSGQTVNYYIHISDTGMPYIGNRIAGFIRGIC